MAILQLLVAALRLSGPCNKEKQMEQSHSPESRLVKRFNKKGNREREVDGIVSAEFLRKEMRDGQRVQENERDRGKEVSEGRRKERAAERRAGIVTQRVGRKQQKKKLHEVILQRQIKWLPWPE